MKRRWVGCAVLTLLCASTVAHAVSSRAFPFRKDMRPVEDREGDLAVVPLDEDVFDKADAVYGNVRVMDSSRREVSHLVRKREADATGKGKRTTYSIDRLAVNLQGKNTVMTFETRATPVDTLVLQTHTPSFSRQVRVESNDSPGAGQGWTLLTGTKITRARLGDVQQRSVRIGLPRVHRGRRYRVTIENLDSPSLAIDGIDAEGPVMELVFLPSSEEECYLFYGGDAHPGRYDLADILARSGPRQCIEFALDWEEPNPDYSPLRAAGRPAGRYVLGVAIVVAMGTLVWLIVRAVRHVDRIQAG